MGLRDDLERFRAVGEENRMDLQEFIEHGQMGEDIKIPIKIVDLPEFVYDFNEAGGIGQAEDGQDPERGDPVEFPEGEGEGDEAGEGEGDHGYYEMDPEEFAEELDEELDLNLEPKGKEVVEETVGDMVEVARAGPRSALDLDYLYTEGLKRKLATWYDRDWVEEACRIEDMSPNDVFEYARSYSLPIGLAVIGDIFEQAGGPIYESIEQFEDEYGKPTRNPKARQVDNVAIRREDERYRHPEIIEKKQKNVVIVNIRDVSGSMHGAKRELVERVFTPMDWYLQGKYEHAEHRYLAHDYSAWEVDRMDFFGIESSGGTKVSSAYELAKEILDDYYPWSSWNRYVFAAGDGENYRGDTEEGVIPLIEEIEANQHAYVEVKPNSSSVIDPIVAHFDDEVATAQVHNRDDVIPAIQKILQAASEDQS